MVELLAASFTGLTALQALQALQAPGVHSIPCQLHHIEVAGDAFAYEAQTKYKSNNLLHA